MQWDPCANTAASCTQEVKESLSSEDVQAVIQETKELKERQVSGPSFCGLLVGTASCCSTATRLCTSAMISQGLLSPKVCC